jgi:O-acetyl-ADP-ribose deacetylase (regulator of RNase III)
MSSIRLEEGDLTLVDADAIVNAANTRLVLGSGVAGAIRERGGPSIQRECDEIGPVGLGAAAITGGGDLAARHVVHAAVMEPGGSATEASIRAATRSALELARDRGLRSIAFPALGTGVGGFSLQRCAEVMLAEATAHLESGGSIEEIRFVLFGEPAYRVFEQVRDSELIRAQLARLKEAR